MPKRNTKSSEVLSLLRRFESRNVTFIEPDGSWPIVWERAKSVHVWDAAGRRYLDWTSAFGVAAAGHANPRVVKAGQRQMARLTHAMGDVHPHPLKAELARELSRLTFERWSRDGRSTGSRTGKTVFCNSGFEAVEVALKTALLATGKRGVIAFQGGYHGLGYGSLVVTHRDYFRGRFRPQLGEFSHFVKFPTAKSELAELEPAIQALLAKKDIGAIMLEPMQGRAGINIPPPEFLPMLRRLGERYEALLIVDEVFTGFGRTGKWFACEHSGAQPDIICLGKALTGGFPLSACVGRADLMDAAWPESSGEALHTSTYLGHPVGCAMALAQIEEIRKARLVKRSASSGSLLLGLLGELRFPADVQAVVRGAGLMVGVELRSPHGPLTSLALKTVKGMLRRGFIVLPEGEHSNVIALTPPLIVSEPQIKRAASALNEAVAEAASATKSRRANRSMSACRATTDA